MSTNIYHQITSDTNTNPNTSRNTFVTEKIQLTFHQVKSPTVYKTDYMSQISIKEFSTVSQ